MSHKSFFCPPRDGGQPQRPGSSRWIVRLWWLFSSNHDIHCCAHCFNKANKRARYTPTTQVSDGAVSAEAWQWPRKGTRTQSLKHCGCTHTVTCECGTCTSWFSFYMHQSSDLKLCWVCKATMWHRQCRASSCYVSNGGSSTSYIYRHWGALNTTWANLSVFTHQKCHGCSDRRVEFQ